VRACCRITTVATMLLPKTEGDLLATLLKLPYTQRAGHSRKLVHAHSNDPALLSLIQELLSTTLLPARIPHPDPDGHITLLFPQSTASKRFLQRELGIDMAASLGPSGVPLLLDAVVHPSTTGKLRAIEACAAAATDAQLVDVYRKSVTATRESLHEAMKAAGRVEALRSLQLWKEPPVKAVVEPWCVVLERDL
jgi:hypothetical protein